MITRRASPDGAARRPPRRHSAVLALCLLLAATSLVHAQTTFNYTGATQTYTVPVGAGAVLMQATGAGGGGGGADDNGPGASGGSGAKATAMFLISAGGTLNAYVGGGGAQGYTSNFGRTCANSAGAGGGSGGSGGFAGGGGGAAGCSGWSGSGGGGGAASVVATASNVTLLVAGGGGGGQGGSWNSTSVTSQNPGVIGVLPGSVGGTGSSFVVNNDGGGGGGGGGGCPGGAGGTTHPDNSGTNFGSSAIFGGSCGGASVLNFTLLSASGGAGGVGQVASDGATNPGGSPGSPGSIVMTPLYALAVNVFSDIGNGGGTANDGAQNGTEAGVGNIVVTATAAGVVVATATTGTNGQATLWLPGTAKGAVITVTPTLPSGYGSTGGSAGNTGGSYTRPTVSFNFTASQAYSGVNFGVIPPNILAPNGAQSTTPGGVVFYSHRFVAGTAGQVTFSSSAVSNPTMAGWNEEIYLDTACSGQWTAADTLITAAITATAGQVICVLVKEFAPSNAPVNATDLVTVKAAFAYSGTAAPPAASITQSDFTTVTAAGTLLLTKRVQNLTTASPYGTSGNALPGQTLQYQLTVVNQGSAPLTTLVIDDATPAFTTFLSAACPTPGTLPSALTACNVSVQPAAGGTGALQYTFAGSLAPGGQTAVTFQVLVVP